MSESLESDTLSPTAEDIARRPSWELMRLTHDVTVDDEDEEPLRLTAGSLFLRVNSIPVLKAVYWSKPFERIEGLGIAFAEKSSGKFDAKQEFLHLDAHLEPALDVEAALPRKCLACGDPAENRGIFCGEEPVFFCDSHYRKDYPLLLPGDGYRESTRPDRV